MPAFKRSFYLGSAIGLLLVEILIALYVHDSVIRPFFGDVLVVILIYSSWQSLFMSQVLRTVSGVLIFAFSIEISQAFNLINVLGWTDIAFAKAILGNSFSWWDIVCYIIGCWAIIAIEAFYSRT